MRTRAIWIGVILVLCACGLAVSQALSWEQWVDSSRSAAPPALAQETRPPASPVLRSRFARPVPVGWSAPRLVEEPGRPGEALLTLLGLPSAHAADVALQPVAGLSLDEAAGVGTMAPAHPAGGIGDSLSACPRAVCVPRGLCRGPRRAPALGQYDCRQDARQVRRQALGQVAVRANLLGRWYSEGCYGL